MVMLQMRTAATNATMPNMLAEAIASSAISRICSPGAKGPAGGRLGDGRAGGSDGGGDGTGGGGGGGEGGEGGRLGGKGGRLGGSGGSEGSGGGGGMGGLKWRPHSTWSSQSLLRYRAACSLYAVCPAPEWK